MEAHFTYYDGDLLAIDDAGEERVLGTIYESCSVGASEFRVEDANGNLVYGISGPCCPCDGPCCEIAF